MELKAKSWGKDPVLGRPQAVVDFGSSAEAHRLQGYLVRIDGKRCIVRDLHMQTSITPPGEPTIYRFALTLEMLKEGDHAV